MTSTYKIGAGLILALALVASAGRLSAQSGYDLFQKALAVERADGNPRQAIDLYERVTREFPADRSLVARALLRIGDCHEKLGNADAQKAYERIIRDFADQTTPAAEASSRLAVLRATDAAATSGPTTRPVWTGASGNDNLGDSISADGRFIAFTDWYTGDIAIRDVQTRVSRRLTSNGAWTGQFGQFPVISPDGTQVAYSWENEEGYQELRVIAAGGGLPRILHRNADVRYLQPFDWSPDQKQLLAVFLNQDRIQRLVTVGAADRSVRVLKSLDWRGPWKAAYSPDGRYVVYDFPPREDAPERDLFVLAADGSRETTLVQHAAHDFLLGWFPGSDRVLFASTRTGANGAWAIRVTDGRPAGDPQLVKPALGQVLPINFTRAGDYFYAQATGVRQSYIATRDPATGMLLGTLTPLTGRFGEGTLAVVWAPDGRRLAYLLQTSLVRGGEGANTLAIRAVESGQTHTIPLNVSYVTRLAWHPDGQSVFVGGIDVRGRTGILRVTLEKPTIEPIVYASTGRYAIAPDGATLFYERRGTQATGGAIVARNLRTGDEREVYTFAGGAAGLALSPDGRQLAVNANLRGADGRMSPYPSIVILPSAGGDAQTLFTFDTPDSSSWRQMTWSPDGAHVLFAKHHQEVWQVAAAGGAASRVLGGLEFINIISVHPDGRQLAVSAGNAKYETWVIERLLPPPAGSARR